jgi:hypothetical protein
MVSASAVLFHSTGTFRLKVRFLLLELEIGVNKLRDIQKKEQTMQKVHRTPKLLRLSATMTNTISASAKVTLVVTQFKNRSTSNSTPVILYTSSFFRSSEIQPLSKMTKA